MSLRHPTHRNAVPKWFLAPLSFVALAVALAVSAALVAHAAATPPAPWTPTLVTSATPLPPNQTGGHYPRSILSFAVDEGRVVWSETDGHDDEIFLYDTATGATTQMTDNEVNDTNASLSGSRLAYLRHTGERTEIVLHDLSTGRELILPSAPDVFGLKVAGEYVVWAEDSDYVPTGEINSQPLPTDLRVYDAGTDTVFTVSTILMGSFASDGKRLVFDTRESPPRIVLVDLATRAARTLSSGSYGAYLPEVAGNLVTWVEGSGQKVGIVVYDIAADRTQTVAARALGGFATPRTDGRYVVWTDHNGSTFEARLFDSETGTVRVISDARFMSGGTQISEGRVAWEQDDEHDSEIYLLDLASGLRTQVSNSRYMDQAVRLSGNTAAWWQYDPRGAGSRIFLSVTSNPAPASGFVDVPGDHRYRTAIAALSEAGVFSGYNTGPAGPEFRPEAPVLRAQLAKMLVEFFHLPVEEGMEVPFGDLGPDDPGNLYPHQYAAALAQSGIATGTAPGVFSPYEPVSRAQAVTMLVRAVRMLRPEVLLPAHPMYGSPGGAFDPTHAPNMAVASTNGILASMVGYGNQWAVWAPMSRAQVAEMLWNLSGLDDVTVR